MKTMLGMPLLLAFASPAVIAAQAVPYTRSGGQEAVSTGISFEALSDTQGAALNPYLGSLAHSLRESLRNSQGATGSISVSQSPVDVVLTIDGTGKLTALRLESADTARSRAVWNAVKEIIYAPLPQGLRSANLTLRIHVAAL